MLMIVWKLFQPVVFVWVCGVCFSACGVCLSVVFVLSCGTCLSWVCGICFSVWYLFQCCVVFVSACGVCLSVVFVLSCGTCLSWVCGICFSVWYLFQCCVVFVSACGVCFSVWCLFPRVVFVWVLLPLFQHNCVFFQCVPIKNQGFVCHAYNCQCLDGYYSSNMSATSRAYRSSDIHE